ncbi:Protein of unknown function DUF1772 [Phaffia rhodozyma]|uniref:DUF1772-domain-containing protein n=1 Tax=Phaffia rhodozyma TaxID=264483 RepID=A0A0F7SH87_PHARH|nr:Protein of unknown function DUF1772 [Phaffia rhodozyma]
MSTASEAQVLSKTLVHAIPIRIPLLVGLTTTSHFLFGNIASATLGLPTWFIDHPAELSAHQKVSGWSYFYKRGKAQYATSALISALSFGLIAYRTPKGLDIRNYAIVACSLASSIGLFTFTAMGSTNARLTELYNNQALVSAVPGGLEEAEAEGLLQKWKDLNAVRMTFAAGAWLAAVGAMVSVY